MLYLSRIEHSYTDVPYYCKKSFMSKPLAVEQVRRKIISADWCGKTSALPEQDAWSHWSGGFYGPFHRNWSDHCLHIGMTFVW